MMPSTVRRILVVEDNDSARAIMCDLCRIFGYEVDSVANGLEAVEAVGRVAYDLVLMDCHMPVMGGLEATRKIRASETGKRVPIVAVTGDGNREACLAAGMDDFLAKPARPTSVRAILSRFLEGKRTSQSTPREELSPQQ
jgi:CheY-like chemotaxis protein